jgi:hypothetical protein
VLSAELLVAARAGDLTVLAQLEKDLREFDPRAIEGDDARIAFWLNLYNARVVCEFAQRPKAGSLLRHRGIFRRVGYTVGGDFYSLDAMEHGLLRLNARPPYSLRRTLKRQDPRFLAAPSKLDPRIHFALNCAAASCPPIQAYDPAALTGQLDLATRAYLAAEANFDPVTETLTLPYLMKLYRADFGGSDRHAEWAAPYLDDEASAAILRTNDGSPAWSGRLVYGPYDWTIATPAR